MKMKKKCLSLAVMIVLFALFLSVSALADYDMWVESYYEITVVQTDSARRLDDYYLFEGVCTGLDFYISGDGTRLVLYGAPLVPGDYYFDVLLTYDDGGYEYMDFWVIVNPIEVVEPDPTPVQAVSGTDTTGSAPTAVPALSITKHPTGETVTAGNSAYFVARADHDTEIIWRLISPAGEVYEAQYADNELDGLGVSGLGTETLTLTNIPLSMNGWFVECKFISINGSSAVTSRAKVTVNAPATPKSTAEPTPAPTEEPQPTEEPALTEEPKPTREPKPEETPVSPVITKDTPTAAGEKGGEGTTSTPEEKKSGGPNLWLIGVIALGVIGVGLVVVLVIILTQKKSAGGETESAATSSPYTFRCDKCGWKPADPNSIPRFCPNCGDVFDEKDVTMAGRGQN